MFRILIAFFILSSFYSMTDKLKPQDAKLIADAGIPLYTEAAFATGNKDVGFRFATTVTPEEVQQWYRKQLPKWSLYNKYGSWILYDGAPDKGMSEIMSVNQVSVTFNDKLPEWHDLDKKMTTEIVIMVVK